MELAAGAGIDPDRISFLKVLKHVRRSVIARTVTTATKMTDFMDTWHPKWAASSTAVPAVRASPTGC